MTPIHSNAENRLVKMQSKSTNPDASKLLVNFTYGYMGRRIKKAVWAWNTEYEDYTDLITDNRFLYDGWNLVGEFNSSGTLQRSYTWGTDLSGSEQGAGGVGGLVMFTDHAGETKHFVAMDGNGNVAGLVDTAGSITGVYEYGPFGEQLRKSGSASSNNRMRWSTKYTDDETDMVYYGHRYYNPSTARWLSRDPIGEDGGNALYAFVGNDGVNNSDVLGLYPATVVSIDYSGHGSAEPDGMDVQYVEIDTKITGQVPLDVSHSKEAASIAAKLDDSFSASIIAWTELRNVPAGRLLQLSTDLTGTITVSCACPSTKVRANYSISASISRLGKAHASFEGADVIADARNRSSRDSGSKVKTLGASYTATFRFDLGQGWIDQLRSGSTLSSVRVSAGFECVD